MKALDRSTPPTDAITKTPAVMRLGKDEMNLAEFPITLLTDRVPAGQKIIEYQDQIYDERSGRTITRKLTVKPAEGTGLPTAVDDDVILALIQLTKANNGFTDRKLDFSRLDLIRMLGWPDSGSSYKRLATSLTRWLGVSLVYENAWWDKRQQSWTTKGFHIIDNFELNDSRTSSGQNDLFPSTILWNQVVFESFESGYLKSIDYDLYMKLEHPTARRMYRFLSKRMYHRDDWTFDLRDLAFEHIGLSRNYGNNAGKIKEKLQPAIDELQEHGFLETASRDDRYLKEGKSWKIRLIRKPHERPDVPEEQPSPALARLIAELTRRTIHPETAADLAKQYPAELIQLKLEVFDWLVAKDDKRVAQNPPGYLIASIHKSYPTPKGFVSAADREKRETAKRQEKDRLAASRRVDLAAAAREREEDRLVIAYWESLTPLEQATLQEAADAQGNPDLVAEETMGAKSFGQRLRRQEYIRQFLRNRQPKAE